MRFEFYLLNDGRRHILRYSGRHFRNILPSEPSRLYIAMRKSALSDGQMRMRPSEPIPKWRSLTCFAVSEGFLTVSSKQFT